MQLFRNPNRLELRAYLVKGSVAIIFALFTLTTLLSIIGLPQIAFSLVANSFPLLIRLVLIVACILLVSAFREAI
jgi:hypothetical protein